MNRRPIRAAAATAATLLALTVLAACGDKDKDDDAEDANTGDSTSQADGAKGAGDTDDDTDESDETDDDDAVAPPLPDGVEIEVLDSGSGDKALMLLHPEEGQVLTTTMDMNMSMAMSGAGATEIPMSMSMETTIDDVTDTEVAYTGRFVDMSADIPGAEGQIEEMLGDLDDFLIHGRSTLTGAPIDAEVEMPDGADPMVTQMMDQMSGQIGNMTAPFPTEPVGEGAVWEATTHMDISLLSVEMHTTYTLEEFDGENYVLAVEAEGTIDSGSQQGIEISDGSQQGSGTMTGSLAVIMPLESTMSVVQSMSMSAGGQSIDSETTMDMTMTTEVD